MLRRDDLVEDLEVEQLLAKCLQACIASLPIQSSLMKRIRGAPEGFETAIIEPTSPRGYGAGATLIMGVVAPVITAVVAVPRSKFFNVKALMAVEIGSLTVALTNLT